ncbi:T9SS type A sorting domain-containing protein [Hymenobacter sp. BT188]|uniref:T9SS type A sorting domain-containing protein n=1 Tax=Hymenobacter sp. BT188 TaxID=2763504 RepID=UPI0016518605|nr:T9SS type A sorting domain-containing protein [Hymenobacter sp. BT188]MBC6607756.1 T9SS type A sorting domain-containing protein [Hymenobacter sp. BT188]
MKTLLTPFTRRSDTVRKLLRIASASLFLLAFGERAQAQFPRVESFKNGTAAGFDMFGTARLTGTGTSGTGYLRLTDATNNQAGTAIDQTAFPAPQGFSISFEFFSYGRTGTSGADGFSVYLIDGATSNFRIGADGGSLGYAQRKRDANSATITPGVSNGYVGIGIDEYGNYSNASEARSGGLVASGLTPDAVTIRGKGNGTASTDYPYIASSGQLGFSLDVAAAQAQEGSGDYRRAFIDFIPFTNASGVTAYRITVRIQHGNTVTTALSNVELPPPPPTLRIGFSGSTGLFNNTHEIRNLAIVRPTIANNDQFRTRYGTAASFNVTTNDQAPGSSLNLNSVDLNPSTATVDKSFTVTDKGTFTVDEQGLVTFVPVSTFAGVVEIPYTIRDILNTLSNEATITVFVSGADLATSLSGSTTANPSSRVTYTVTTSNLGGETAFNVIPTLRLPLTATNVSLPTGATIATVGGEQVVTFATVSSLLANDPAIVNAVTFTVPTTGTVTGTASSTSSVPDPTLTNNTATVSTLVSGVANVSTSCATPGKDGFGTLISTSVPNTYFPVAIPTTVAAGQNNIVLGTAGTGNTPISAGDLVLIMQMQGATMSIDNSSSYGTISSDATYTAGKYEYAIATNDVPLTGGTLTLAKGVTNQYESNAGGTGSTSQRRFQVIRVPQYSSVSITGTLSGPAWNGTTGGVLVLDVAGQTRFVSNASINMTAKGFRGGGGVSYSGDAANRTDYVTAPALAHGSKGEGTAGSPRNIYNGTAVISNTINGTVTDGYFGGSNGAGAPGNAGGGATDYGIRINGSNSTYNNSGNAGGAGGGNGANGGVGGYGYESSNNGTGLRALGGAATLESSISRIVLGGGGGAGSTNDANAAQSSGGVGGGIIMLQTGSISGTGLLVANGGNAPSANGNTSGGGGGGAGGTVLIRATPPATIGNGLNGITVQVNGGNGGNTSTGGSDEYGPGGGGGGGLAYSNGNLSNFDGVGGSAGRTGLLDLSAFGAANGTSVTNPSVSTTAVPTNNIAGAGSCLPTLAATLSTPTPNVTRSGDAVNPATYALVISNTGGAATGVSVETALTTDLFKYDNTVAPTVTLTLAGGIPSPYTEYTAPTTSTSTPVFSGLNIPAGATLRISFRATIASTAVNNTAYQASATVRFLDPTRLTATSIVSPAGTFAGGGTVPGSNYAAAASTAEDVTIVRPLPVELKEFKATAVRQDAQLNWATASELNNDRFVIERSLDGLSFSTIGTVRGKGTTTQQSKYSFTDAGVARFGALIYYRLKQLDFDGTATFSPVRTVKFVDAIKVDVSVYPNPSQGGATLDLTALPAGNYQVQLLDLTGRSLQILTLAGQQEHPLQVQALPHGSYIVRVRGAAVNVALPLVRN